MSYMMIRIIFWLNSGSVLCMCLWCKLENMFNGSIYEKLTQVYFLPITIITLMPLRLNLLCFEVVCVACNLSPSIQLRGKNAMSPYTIYYDLLLIIHYAAEWFYERTVDIANTSFFTISFSFLLPHFVSIPKL